MTEWATTTRLFASLFVHVLLLTVFYGAVRRRFTQASTEALTEQKPYRERFSVLAPPIEALSAATTGLGSH
jgi:hypothetical protein